MDKFEYKKYLYYGIIGIVSFVMLVFMPMLGSDVGIDFLWPTTLAGWLIFIITKIIISGLNILIFYCFMEQAKINVRDEEKYKEAIKILLLQKNNKKFIPRSPEEYNKREYGFKATTLFITSLISAAVLTNCLLTFDYMTLLVYGLTLIIGITFGIIQMKSSELYWTNEFWQYAKKVEAEEKENKISKEELEKCLTSMEKNLEI